MDWEKLALSLRDFRRKLHQHPELSGQEKKTAAAIIAFAESFHPDRIHYPLGGEGVAIVFNGTSTGPAVLIRCELDALPIAEINDFPHRSVSAQVSHKCGHDGHMAIVSGLMPLLGRQRPQKGKVVLLFQPAEETGAGALKVINDLNIRDISPDMVFALHNLPGFEKGAVVVKNDAFASASKGMIITLNGKTSHAAEPEYGISPALAVAELIPALTKLPQSAVFSDFTLVTIVHALIGERAFGTSPGHARLMATLRAANDSDMAVMTDRATEMVNNVATRHKLKVMVEWVEEFPATVNHPECVSLIVSAAKENSLELQQMAQPFRWSEDFGHFTHQFKGAMFGLGSGKNHPQLHHPDYDFPDEIIIDGTKMFYSIILKILS
ncbi:MAG: amidohydrolase [Bacteroidales bacterium]|nr:amidohydrolase [Bacteroidales bacterium]